MAKRMGGRRKAGESKADMKMDKKMGIKEGSARDEKMDMMKKRKKK